MKYSNAIAEDTFEKAREEFFGTAKTATKSNSGSAEMPKPQSEPSPKEVNGVRSDK